MINRGDLEGRVSIPGYGSGYYLLDNNNLIIQPPAATGIIIEALTAVLNSRSGSGLSSSISAYLGKGRKFSLSVACQEEDGKTYLVPHFNHQAVVEIRAELTAAVANCRGALRSGGMATVYPLKQARSVGDKDVPSMSRRTVRNVEDALSYATAAGLVASSAIVHVWPAHVTPANDQERALLERGAEAIWLTINLNFTHDTGATRDDRLEALRWFTPIDNQTFLKAQAGQEHYFLARPYEVHALLAQLGLRDEYLQAEILAEVETEQRRNLPACHHDRVKKMDPIPITLADKIGAIRDEIVRSHRLREIVMADRKCSNQEAEDELTAAFNSGVHTPVAVQS